MVLRESIMADRKVDVRISQDFDGSFTVFNEREPVFCFIRGTREEAIELARTTLREYHRIITRRAKAAQPVAARNLKVIQLNRAEPVEVEA